MHANNMHKDMVDIQPRLKELQEQYKDNPQKL
jgi:membrane protein insertase Oxa1/YidC/SpoIIIJ